MAVIEQLPKWVCDRCDKTIESKRKPNSWRDPWGHLMIDQDAGWDTGGVPWCPRQREKILLCGTCIEEIIKVVNEKKELI